MKQKIKITSTALISSEKMEEIDFSFGMSYFIEDSRKMKTYDESNSWSFKILAKINKIEQFFNKKDNETDNEVIEQIINDSRFIITQYPENAKNLEIQINAKTMMSRTIALLSKINIKNTIHIIGGLESKAGSMYYKEKKMFLGLNLFKQGSNIYEQLKGSMTTKEVVSYVYFHEYSHAAQLENKKYDTPENVNVLDLLYENLFFLAEDTIEPQSNYKKLLKHLHKNNKEKEMPSELLIDTLTVLYMEIYADTGSLLLLRNKAIIENKEMDLKTMTSHVINMRNEEKLRVQRKLTNTKLDSCFLRHDHYTSPGLEALPKHVEEMLKNKDAKTILSEKEIHEIAKICMQEGIAKTILVMIEADKEILAQLSIVALLDKNKCIVDKYKNYHKDLINKIYEIVPEQWVKSFQENIAILNQVENKKMIKKKNSIIFDAGLHSVNFYKKIHEHYFNVKQMIAAKNNSVDNIEEDIKKMEKSILTMLKSKSKKNNMSIVNKIKEVRKVVMIENEHSNKKNM